MHCCAFAGCYWQLVRGGVGIVSLRTNIYPRLEFQLFFIRSAYRFTTATDVQIGSEGAWCVPLPTPKTSSDSPARATDTARSLGSTYAGSRVAPIWPTISKKKSFRSPKILLNSSYTAMTWRFGAPPGRRPHRQARIRVATKMATLDLAIPLITIEN